MAATELLSLDGKNFRAWKTRVMRTLKAEGLLEMVIPYDGKERPSEEQDAEEEAQAQDIIKRSLSNEVLMFLPSYTSANDLWKYLAEAYTTEDDLQTLSRRLESLMFKEGEDVKEHSNKLKRLFVELSACGQPPDLNRQMELFSQTFPPEFEYILTAACQRSRTFEQAVNYVSSRITLEDEHLPAAEASGSSKAAKISSKDEVKRKSENKKSTSPSKNKPSSKQRAMAVGNAGVKDESRDFKKEDIETFDARNPVSLARITEAGYNVVFDAHGFRVMHSDGRVVFGSY